MDKRTIETDTFRMRFTQLVFTFGQHDANVCIHSRSLHKYAIERTAYSMRDDYTVAFVACRESFATFYTGQIRYVIALFVYFTIFAPRFAIYFI